MCESKDTESPRIVMFLKNGELRKISIAWNGVVVDKAQIVTIRFNRSSVCSVLPI